MRTREGREGREWRRAAGGALTVTVDVLTVCDVTTRLEARPSDVL